MLQRYIFHGCICGAHSLHLLGYVFYSYYYMSLTWECDDFCGFCVMDELSLGII